MLNEEASEAAFNRLFVAHSLARCCILARVNQPAPPQPSAQASGCLHYLLFAGASVWIIGVTVLVHLIGWSTDQVLLIQGTPLPWYAWPLISWGHALLVALPVVPLAYFTREPRLQAVYRVWLLAIAFIVPLGLVRALPITWNQPAALAQIFLSLILAAGLILLARMRGRRLGLDAGALLLGLALAPLVMLPSLIFGALGSPLDALLNLLAGVGLGLYAGVLISTLLMAPLAEHPASPGRDLALGCFAAGIALLILGAGFGFNGSQLLLMLALPPLGLAAAGLGRYAGATNGRDRGWLAVTALVGLGAAAPLMFFDPEELALILGNNEILNWALTAAGLSFLIGLVLGLVILALGRRLAPPEAGRRRPVAALLGGLVLAWGLGLAVYGLAGQPGFYGERLFVILADQADVSAAYAIEDRGERADFVYSTLVEHAFTNQAGLRAALDRVNAAYTPYYLVNAIEVEGGTILRLYLETQPGVDRVLESPRLRPLPAPVPVAEGEASAPSEPQWNITSIGAAKVWEEFGVTGQGIVVGQSDSGAQGDHPALREGYRGREGGDDYNWYDPWNGTTVPTDIGGHGTHTLGSVLGRGGIGVAPGAEWFGCANLARNLGNPALYLDCMQFMLAPFPQGGDPLADGDPARAAHVLNNSWGCPPLEGCDALALQPAAEALRAAGLFVVVSAGNEGPRCGSVDDPIALYDSVFSVGALEQSGNVAFFSSRGPVEIDGSERVKPDIVAPGVEVLSSYPNSTYAFNSGTSMAGPHVAGVVALLWSAQPELIGDMDRTEQILIQTADALPAFGDECAGTEIPNNLAGYGVVNAYEAVKMALGE
jgi:hypothetical protein